MNVHLNDRIVTVCGGDSLSTLLECAGLKEMQGTAAAVNGNVVPRTGWETFALKEGDQIILFKASQGG